MSDREWCPMCGSFETERVHVEWHPATVEETRVCKECDVQYTNEHTLTDKIDIHR